MRLFGASSSLSFVGQWLSLTRAESSGLSFGGVSLSLKVDMLWEDQWLTRMSFDHLQLG